MSGSDDAHGFLPHHHIGAMGLSALGSADADWPTGADLYAPSSTGSSSASLSTPNDAMNMNGHPSPVSMGGYVHHPAGDMSGAAALSAAAAMAAAGAQLPMGPIPTKRGGRKSSKGAGRASAGDGLRSPNGSSEKVEVIICQGTATVIPKSRSTVERRYVCNGHPIHRVTFWRHRKHGCPHVTGEGGEGYMGDGSAQEGMVPQMMNMMAMVPSVPTVPKPKRAAREKANNAQMMAQSGEMDNGDMSPRFTQKMEPQFSHPNMSMKMKSMSMGYPLVDAVVDIAPQHNNPYNGSNFPMNEITPGNVPTQLDANSLGPQVPSFQGTHSSQFGFMRAPGQGMMPNPAQSHMMPPFSLLTDALNLYYAPYRPAELDEEEISSPIHTTYVNHSSPYNSDRSEASDFMEDPASDGVFKSYLERHE